MYTLMIIKHLYIIFFILLLKIVELYNLIFSNVLVSDI